MKINIPFEITEESQKLAAVTSGGELFASQGGIPLMLTEFVENGNDAIKAKQVQYNKKSEKELVIIEIDELEKSIRILDTGTGILQPIHICKKPFISLKSGEKHTTGQFGRGSQVFRGFCNTLQFITLRNTIHDEEIKLTKEPSKCIKLTFEKEKASGTYENSTESEFRHYCDFETGTVAILKGWTDADFERMLRKKKEIILRLQHHFGFELEGKYQIKICVKEGYSILPILPRNYTDDLLDEKYDLPSILLQNPHTGKSYGNVDFHIFKTTQKYKHKFKSPFLIVNERPLGDSFIANIPELIDIADIWKSSFITGYIICNGVKTNQLRVGMDNNDESKSLFLDAIQQTTTELKKQVFEWKTLMSQATDQMITQEVATEIQRFFKRKGLKLNFKHSTKQGASQTSEGNNDQTLVSKSSGGDNIGRIEFGADDVDDITFRKPGNTITVKHRKEKSKSMSDGNDERKVKINSSLVSKGGRKRHKIGTGPNIDFYNDELDTSILSNYEVDPPTVYINQEHRVWKNLLKKVAATSENEKTNKLKKRYMGERYMWELITKCYGDTGDKKINDIFWDTYYDFYKDEK